MRVLKTCMLISVLLFLSMTGNAMGFLYEVEIKEEAQIKKFSNDVLIDTYVDVLIELEATKSFHEAAGYTPKEYKKYKELLRYRYNLLKEMTKREIEPPKYEPSIL